MIGGLRAVCSCGATFALPQEAFTSGTTCPGCGHEVTRAELEAFRPAGVSESTRKSSIVILAVLALAQLAYLARRFFDGEIKRMAEVFRDLGRTLPAITKLVLYSGLVPGFVAALAVACIGVAAVGLRARRDPRRSSFGAVACLMALLAASIFVPTIVNLAVLLPLIDLIHSLN